MSFQQSLTNQQLSFKILQAQNLNRKLSLTLKNLQAKIQQKQKTHSLASSKHEATSKKQEKVNQKIISNIDKRIAYYQHQINLLANTSSENCLAQIRELQSHISKANQANQQYLRQIRKLQDKFHKQQFNTKNDDHTVVEQINEQFRQIEELKKKLNRLEHTKIETQQLKPRKKMKSLFVKKQKGLQTSVLLQQQKSKHSIDKQALYKNLIKYYLNEQSRLKVDIEKLQKEREEFHKQQQKIEAEIKECEQEVEKLRQTIKPNAPNTKQKK